MPLLISIAAMLGAVSGVMIFNDRPRYDTLNRIVDCHSGVILKHNDTYFYYGEQ